MASDGASAVERLIAACRQDSVDQLMEVLEEGIIDINGTDAVGNTALHIAAKNGSMDCIEQLIKLENIDVDKFNRLDHKTALHLAASSISDPEVSEYIIGCLLELGANPKLVDGKGNKPLDLIPSSPDMDSIRQLINNSITAQDLGLDMEEESDSDDEGASSE